MRPIILGSTRSKELTFSSGPGAPIFENTGSETRIYRAPVRAISSVRFGEKEVYGQVLDLSPGGCLLKTETTIEIGTEIEMRVTIVHHDRRSVADIRGVIRRTHEVEGRRGYGVEFLAEDTSERRSLDWLYGQALNG